MIRLLLAASVAALPLATATAAEKSAVVDPERRAAALRLLEVSNFRARQAVRLDDGVEAARANALELCMNQAMAGKSVNCPQSVPLAPERRERTLDALVAAAQSVYAETYTTAEMVQLTQFFETGIGRKYERAAPGIIARVQAVRRRLLQNELKTVPAAGAGARP